MAEILSISRLVGRLYFSRLIKQNRLTRIPHIKKRIAANIRMSAGFSVLMEKATYPSLINEKIEPQKAIASRARKTVDKLFFTEAAQPFKKILVYYIIECEVFQHKS